MFDNSIVFFSSSKIYDACQFYYIVFFQKETKNENKNRDIASHFQNQFMITVTCTIILYYNMYMSFPP